MPRTVIQSVVSAGQRCCTLEAWHEGAIQATKLLCTFCAISVDSRTLIRAIEVGALDLLWDIGKANPEHDTSYLASHIASSMSLATVLRAVARCYARFLVLPGDPDGIDRGRNVALLRKTFQDHFPAYSASRKRKDWKRRMGCHNAMGPHNTTVRFCACGRTFYCSGSYQRMHWKESHGEKCSGNEPWSMNGRVSLNDVLYLTVHVREHIRKAQSSLAAMIAPLKLRSDQQITITIDLSNPLEDKSGSVNIDEVAPNSSREVVLVKVWFRVGGIRRLQPLAFTYKLNDFRQVKHLP
ncbi:hypothetical protein K523DRAFT_341128 [Schizophyllum commune Tattone D]|nr:hypothetical protein K523DRAFT_341128 [Schizophyllum commune Tattone D]